MLTLASTLTAPSLPVRSVDPTKVTNGGYLTTVLIVVLSAKTCITCICATWRHSQLPGQWCTKIFSCNALIQFRKLRSLWHNFLSVTNMAFVEGVKCPSFHTQFLDCFECGTSTLQFRLHFSVNALLHSKYEVFIAPKYAIWDTAIVFLYITQPLTCLEIC